jgi:hypothetical protein
MMQIMDDIISFKQNGRNNLDTIPPKMSRRGATRKRCDWYVKIHPEFVNPSHQER